MFLGAGWWQSPCLNGARRLPVRTAHLVGGLLTLKKLIIGFCLPLALSVVKLAGAQTLTATPSPLTLSGQAGVSTVQGTVTFTSTGAPINFTVTPGSQWLQVSAPPSGNSFQTPASVTVTANVSQLPAGTTSAQGTLQVFNVSTPTFSSVPVNLSLSTLGVSPQSVAFTPYQAGSSTFPAAQVLTVTGGAFSISKAPADNWYTAAISGTPANAVVVSVNQAVLPTLAIGSYNGTLTITPTGVSNPVPVAVPVSLSVAAAPVVTVNPSPTVGLSFDWQVGGTNNQSQQTIALSSNAATPLNFALLSSVPWITFPNTNPTSIQPSGSMVAVTVNGAGLVAQSAPYTGTVTITVQGAVFSNGQSSIAIPVSLLVSNFPLINVSTGAINFSYQFGSGMAIQPATLTPTSTAAPGTQLQFTVGAGSCTGGSWLVTPAGLQTTGTALQVSVSSSIVATLAPQTYTCTLTITPTATGSGTAQQAAISIPVTLNVTNSPALVVSSNALVFAYQTGLTPAASAPAPQTVTIASSSGAPLSYTVSVPSSATAPWLQVTGNPGLMGTTDQTSISVAVNPAAAAAGTNDTSITISATDPSTGLAVASQSIDVKLFDSASPLLTVTPPGPIVLTGVNGPSQPQTITLNSTNSASPLTIGPLQFNIPGNWLSSNQPPSTTPGSFTITGIPASGMAPGTYPGTITISATGGSGVADSPYVVPVTFQLNAATAAVNQPALTFTQPLGGTAAAAQQVSVTSSGAVLPFTAVPNDGAIGWLKVTSGTGSTPGSFSVSTDASRLTSGTYTGAVYVTVPNAGQIRIPVTFTVTPGTISAPTTALNFTQIAGGTAPAAQTVAVSGTSGLNFSVATSVTSPASGTWLTATVGSGTSTTGATPANVVVSVNAGSLTPNTYTGTVTITSPGATGSPITIPVNLTVTAAVTLTAAPTTVSFPNYVVGTAAPAAQNVQLSASASAPFTATVKTTDGGSWLTVTPASGTATTAAQAVSVGINTTGLKGAGTYTGTITFSSPSALAPATVNVTLTAVSIPAPVISGLQNDASYTSGAVAPGENIVIYGTGIGPATTAGLTLTSTGTVSTNVGGTQVFFDTTPAPIIYTGSGQTSVMVPHEVAGRTSTQITVVYQGVSSAPLTYNVAAASPGIYTQNSMGSGPGSIVNYQDGSVNGPAKGVAAGSYIYVYLTGTGETSPALVTGAVNPANGTNLKNSLITYTATIAGVNAPVLYQGTAPGFVEGVMQFNIQVPAGIASGPQPIVITGTSGGITYSTQPGVTVQVQ